VSVFVLDASAILCLIRGEAGAEVVKAALPGSAVSAVNMAEVMAKMIDLGMNSEMIDAVLDPLQLRVIPFDGVQARTSGLLRERTRAQGLSLGDRACLALATHLDATALTTDRAWRDVGANATVAFAR
jgi:PIN domain nuclease of toxin-antitoxin system